jgi:hypothetical protein
MDIMDAAKQAEEGAARKAEEDAVNFACRDIIHWHYERRKLKAARKLLKGKGLSPARKYWLKCWISAYTVPPPGFIGMLSIQEGGLRAPLVGYISKTAEILSEEEFLNHARMKPSDFARNRGKLPFDRLMRIIMSLVRTSISAKIRRIFAGEGADLEAAQQSFCEARAKIKWEAFELLFDATIELAYSGYFQTWHGYRVSAIDGSRIALRAADAPVAADAGAGKGRADCAGFDHL